MLPASGAWIVPRWRWGVVWLLFTATLLNYTDRLALANTQRFLLPEFAPTPELQKSAYAELNFWFGIVFGLGQVPAGYLVDRLSLRRLYVGAILIWSLAGMLTGLVPAGALGLLIGCRVVLAAGEAFNWPCAVTAIQRTIPRESRGLANGIFHGGASVGAMLTPLLVLAIVNPTTGEGWRTVFLVVGAAGLVWAGIWLAVTSGSRAVVIDTPNIARDTDSPPLGRILIGPLFLIGLVTSCGVNLCWHLYNQWLPRHLDVDLGVPAGRDQIILVVFYLCADLGSVLAGWTARVLARRGVRVARARQLVMTGLALGTASAGLGAMLVPGLIAKVVLFCVVAATAVGGFSVFFALVQDVSGRHTAKLLGLCGCIAWLLISGVNYLIQGIVGAGVPTWLLPAAACTPLLAAAAGWCWPVRQTDGAALPPP